MRSNISESVNISLLLDTYGELLTDRQKQICAMFHEEDYSLGEIASELGITRQGVRAVLQKSETLLRGYESRLRLAGREEERLKKADALRERVEALEAGNLLSHETAAELISGIGDLL